MVRGGFGWFGFVYIKKKYNDSILEPPFPVFWFGGVATTPRSYQTQLDTTAQLTQWGFFGGKLALIGGKKEGNRRWFPQREVFCIGKS